MNCHPIVNATKQAAEETRKELEPMKKTLADIDGSLNRPVAGPRVKNVDTTFGIFRRQNGQLQMGSEIVGVNENTLTVGDREYDLTPGIHTLIVQKHPQRNQWTSGDYQAYKSLAAQTKVKSYPNPRGVTRPCSTWKYKHMLKRMIVPGESIPEEESEDSEGTDTDSMGDISEPGILSPVIMSSDSGIMSPGPSPAHTRSYGKARKKKYRGAFGVVYLPGDITDS